MHFRLLFIFLLLLSSFCNAQYAEKSFVFVKKGEKYGCIDSEGKVMIPAAYDELSYFSEGLIAVNIGAREDNYLKKGGKWGFLDSLGKMVVALKYQEAKPFTHDVAAVKLNDRYGFINKNGQTLIDFIFEDAQSFHEGLAAAKVNGKWGFIDKSGKWKIEPVFDKVENFKSGFSKIFHLLQVYEVEDDDYTYLEEEGKFGLINKSGELVLDTIYNYIGAFENGFAKIELEGKEGFINSIGKIVIPIEFDVVEDFSEGMSVVANFIKKPLSREDESLVFKIDSLNNHLEKLLDSLTPEKLEEIINQPAFMELKLAQMQLPQNELMHGYIDSTGGLKIDYEYHEAGPFLNGLAAVRKGVAPFISMVLHDHEGNEIPGPYEENGLGANLIDKNGKLLLKENFRILNRYSDSTIIAYNYKGAGAYSENGEQLIDHKYLNLQYLGKGFYISEDKNSGKKYLLDKKGEKIIAIKFSDVTLLTNNRLLVSTKNSKGKKSKFGIIDFEGKWILKPIYDFATVINQNKLF